MVAVDLRAVRAVRGLAGRFPLALLAIGPSVLPITQRPNAALCHKKDRASAQRTTSLPQANTIARPSRSLSAPCALLPHSFSRERKSTPSFSMACARFWRNGGIVVREKINNSQSTTCKLREAPTTERAGEIAVPNHASGPQPIAQPRMRQPHLCVIVFGRPPVSARRVSRILKTQSEVHSL
jgi:hypothetical protein